MPLFLEVAQRLIPVGTAFTIGRGVGFAISAAHNLQEVLKYEQRLGHLQTAQSLPKAIALKEVGLYLLCQGCKDESNTTIEITLLPLETFDGAPPTDVVFGFPQFQTELPFLALRVSFDPPPHGEKVWAIGYTEFKYPEGGIDLDQVRAGRFDWFNDYGHLFRVVEGRVDRIFTQRLAAGYVGGPCFTFDAEIFHGQSGGPVMNEAGLVRGVNSATATNFFNRPTTVASMLYPLLLTSIRSGVDLAPGFRMNSVQPILNWVTQGIITTDGSEEHVSIRPVGESFAIGCRTPVEVAEFVHDDFLSFQEGRKATVETNEYFQLRRTEAKEET